MAMTISCFYQGVKIVTFLWQRRPEVQHEPGDHRGQRWQRRWQRWGRDREDPEDVLLLRDHGIRGIGPLSRRLDLAGHLRRILVQLRNARWLFSGQSYKCSITINYETIAVLSGKLTIVMTLDRVVLKIVPGPDVIRATLCWNNEVWFVIISHVTLNNQSEWLRCHGLIVWHILNETFLSHFAHWQNRSRHNWNKWLISKPNLNIKWLEFCFSIIQSKVRSQRV